MSLDHFPDNTVLCNFGSVQQLGLLESVLDGRGRWTEAVKFEAGRSEAYVPSLATISSGGWLGEPIAIFDDDEKLEVEGIRRAVFGGTKAKPLRHLGEAQTLWVIKNRYEVPGATWVSDDRESLDYATREGVPVKTTVSLVAEAVQIGTVTASSGFAMLDQMVQSGQKGIQMPGSAQDLLYM